MTDRVSLAFRGYVFYLGLDIGSSSVKLAVIDDAGALRHTASQAHKGAAASAAAALVGLARGALELSDENCGGWCVTGSGSCIVRDRDPRTPVLEEVPALTRGAALLAPQARSLIEIGAQKALFITGMNQGKPPRFSANDGCAAGTGSFFEDQMERLGARIEDYSRLVARASYVPRLSGRCSVFAKTDIIHRQQEGVPVEDILLGLCYALVKSYKALIVRNLPVERPVALSGGCLRNQGVVSAVRSVFGLDEHELLIDEGQLFFQAAGAALHARVIARSACGRAIGSGADEDICAEEVPGAPYGERDRPDVPLAVLVDALGAEVGRAPLVRTDPLPALSFDPGCGFRLRPEPWPVDQTGLTPCFLGIDVGSTSTNLVLVDEEGALLDAQYLRTRGNPRQAVRTGLESLGARLGDRVAVRAAATTGSGRSLIGAFVGADIVRDEITAQARAAAQADPRVDTVFEIGGQDSKYIALKDGAVVDFQMNKICAAGTGSFVEEQAARLGIPLSDYGDLALSALEPVDLGERCTVFVETAVNAALAKGADKRDVAAGLCQSIVRNYLHRVVGANPVGARIVLQGGVAYNTGIVAAFKQFYGDRLTVSPWFAVSGAVGAALLAAEAAGDETAFKGFDLKGSGAAAQADDAAVSIEENRALFRESRALLLSDYDGAVDPGKKTVGVPRSLMAYKLFPLAHAFFRQLGFNVIISDESGEDIVRLSQQAAQGETCYPVKLIYGHMQQLLDRGVDYIFMPSIHTIRHKHSKLAHNYGCPYMHEAPRIVAEGLKIEQHGATLLSPLLDLDFGQRAMADAMLGVGEQLGCDRRSAALALLSGSQAVAEFTRKTEELGERLLSTLAPNERVIVMVTRNYGIEDAVLNMGIPDALIDRGQKVISISHLHGHDLDISADYPNVYWPFGQHILSSVKIIARDPRLFAVYLTNHGCGPDTMLSHLVAEEMGDKPYLQIEVDEHFSKVGVITRIEAFLNSLDHYQALQRKAADAPDTAAAGPNASDPSLRRIDQNTRRLSRDLPVAVPALGLHGKALAAWLSARGFDVRAVSLSDAVLARGKEFSTTKEYLSFAALLGLALEARSIADGPIQLLLPSGEGADADGQYDRVIRSIVESRAAVKTLYVAPRLERLPEVAEDPEGLFNCLMAADVAALLPVDERERMLKRVKGSAFSFEAVANEAARIGCMALPEAVKRIGVVGEWPVVVDDFLTGGVFADAAHAHARFVRMPFAEYCWFLWMDAVGEEADQKVLLEVLRERMGRIHRALGTASPFAADVRALRARADALVGNVRAANARYRMSKMHDFADRFDGVVAVASMYENTDVMLQLMESRVEPSTPCLHLSFDGSLDSSLAEKLGSFLYYL